MIAIITIAKIKVKIRMMIVTVYKFLLSFDYYRLAYHESVQLGQELSKRINEEPEKKEGDDDWSDEEGGGFETEGSKGKTSARAAKEMMTVLEGAEEDPAVQGKYRRLFEMDFMKKASDQQNERSREEAQNILREIEDMENGDGDSDADDRENGKKLGKVEDSNALAAAREEMKKRFGGGGSGAMTLQKGDKKVSVSGPISIKGKIVAPIIDNSVRWVSEPEATVKESVKEEDSSDNPWLSVPVAGKKRDSTGQQVTHAKSMAQGKGQSKSKGDDMLYVSVAKTTTAQNGKSNDNGINGNKLLEIPLVSGKKRSAPAATVNNDKNDKKKKTGQTVPGASEGFNPVSTAVAVPVKQSNAQERKPLLMQKSQVSLGLGSGLGFRLGLP
jgi:hypothetical protein